MERYGVYQDKDVTKYVSLVGGVIARESSRPSLNWRFIVLDTDGVNAFAAPGGAIHVTRGLLGLTRNEAELAGVLGHEITHVTAKHTVRAIEQSKAISMGSRCRRPGFSPRPADSEVVAAGVSHAAGRRVQPRRRRRSGRKGASAWPTSLDTTRTASLTC